MPPEVYPCLLKAFLFPFWHGILIFLFLIPVLLNLVPAPPSPVVEG